MVLAYPLQNLWASLQRKRADPGGPTMSRTLEFLLAAAVALALAPMAPAHAGPSGTSDVACGSTAAGWNAPRGALIASRGKGPVGAVIDAIGEWRTHIMMSHGVGGYVTHSTMYSPGTTGWPTYCSTPLNPGELEHGYPGGSQVNQGAIYKFLYGSAAPTHLAYTLAASGTRRTQAESVADHAWYDAPYQWAASKQDATRGLWVLGTQPSCDYQWAGTSTANNCPTSWNGTGDGCDCGCQFTDGDCAFKRFEYSTYQYKNIENRTVAGFARNNGTQCSSITAHYFYEDSGGQEMTTHTYGYNQVVAAGNGLYNAVERECSDGLGFWGGIGSAITCFESICDDAARQVRNCFIDSTKCDTDSSSPWSAVVNNSGSNARSISPDRNVGAGPHSPAAPTGGYSGATGPWAGAGAELQIQWNSGGNVYGCWF